jgi:hypothetical protein
MTPNTQSAATAHEREENTGVSKKQQGSPHTLSPSQKQKLERERRKSKLMSIPTLASSLEEEEEEEEEVEEAAAAAVTAAMESKKVVLLLVLLLSESLISPSEME